jgi:hypothetical protein
METCGMKDVAALGVDRPDDAIIHIKTREANAATGAHQAPVNVLSTTRRLSRWRHQDGPFLLIFL